MWPQLKPGDEVLVDPGCPLRRGDIVVARHPFRRDVHIIKRLDGWHDDGALRLLGDNADESSDSRTLGHVPPDLVVGRVTSQLPAAALRSLPGSPGTMG